MQVIDPRDVPAEQWRPGTETRMRVSALNGAAQLCIFEQWIAPGSGAPTHSHPVEEVLTVLAGEAEMWLDDARAIVSAGQSLLVPAGRSHGFRNSGTMTLHIHAVLAAPVFEATWRGRARWCGDGIRPRLRFRAAAVGWAKAPLRRAHHLPSRLWMQRWARRFAPLPTLRIFFLENVGAADRRASS